ncbi:hypothetical protein JTB14_013338 [Gonioctena quinquepunctata]|nr:hypothetical protein JTB14_013338 [Gonioctena quinquepunctata]
MPRNQVVPDRFPQKKNNFTRKPKKFDHNKIRPETSFEVKNSEVFFKPSVSGGSNNFFVKPSEKSSRKSKRRDGDQSSERNNPKSIEDGSRNEQSTLKKPFDKKKYRLKKYSNKYKLEQWGERRKHAVVQEYYRQIKDDQPHMDVSKIYNDPRNQDSDDEDTINEENENNLNANITQEEITPQLDATPNERPLKKPKPFQRAQQEFQRLKEEKQKKREEFLNKKAEKEEALKKYRKEKAAKFKKLSRRTKKGQPIMKDRMEMLLEKIQNSMK